MFNFKLPFLYFKKFDHGRKEVVFCFPEDLHFGTILGPRGNLQKMLGEKNKGFFFWTEGDTCQLTSFEKSVMSFRSEQIYIHH